MGQTGKAVAVFAVVLMAAHAEAADDTGQPLLRVRVDNQAAVPGAVLRFAEARAGQVFREAGVVVEWVGEDEAIRRHVRADFTVLVMAEAPAKLKAAAEHLGLDVMGQGAPVAARAYIYYDRIAAAVTSPHRDVVTVLGDVMAHELGHLLLPPGHSSIGIMRPQIDMMSRTLATFTKDEAAEIRRRLASD